MVPGSAKMSRYTIAGGDLAALAARFAAARAKAARTGKPVRIVSCYEAGFDGHWLHRWLTEQGVINHVIDPASIQVNRRARRVTSMLAGAGPDRTTPQPPLPPVPGSRLLL